ncbi:Methyltransferase domain-containing protein [Thermomonospora echinospora]|uniref:Methyltransferase domain-containing protein n=1 Tax=Thermomonospora echinospora TaxID=1992 RepID=A0A1H6CA79_9ACTN|nr:class I SAM-dependent methyltransferase [Thermomonospora echinospora]SEG69812.1 Methyltransferase domain-containing protein [Thermomonospora echinospora]
MDTPAKGCLDYGAAAESPQVPGVDGFGELLRDCYRAGARRGVARQVIERSDGFVSVEDAFRYFTRPDEWMVPERRAVELAAGRVLDVGCGAGRHMIAMRNCQEVVGIDPSPGAVEVARSRGLDARLGTVQRPGDLGTFDTIMLLGGNLGLLGSREQAPKVLGSLARLARPGARMYAIGRDPYAVRPPEHLRYHDTNRKAGRMPGQVRMRLRYRCWASAWFDRLMVSPYELEMLVTGSPWRLLDCSAVYATGFFLAELQHVGTQRAITDAPATTPPQRSRS